MFNQQPHNSNILTLEEIFQPLMEEGFQGIKDVVETICNQVMLIQRDAHLNAGRYERTEARVGHANGFKPKGYQTSLGKLNLSIPQTRGTDFYPPLLEKGNRTDNAFIATIAQMYVEGVATRKVESVLEKLCDCQISASQVSRFNKSLDDAICKWKSTQIGEVSILIVDARYEKVRFEDKVLDCSLLVAYGILPDGSRCVLDYDCAISEAEIHWRKFFNSLVQRGLHGLKLFVSDANAGLKVAKQAVFPTVPWQRCQFHLQQNAPSHVLRKKNIEAVQRDINAIFNAPSLEEAKRLLKLTVEKYTAEEPKLSSWMEENIPEGLTVFSIVPTVNATHKKLRTSNMAERFNRELKKRTHLVRVFPNEDALSRLVGAMMMEYDETWRTNSRRYINPLDLVNPL